MSDPAAAPEVFIAYAPADEPLRAALETHLAALSREGSIKTWHRGRVEAGRDMERELAAKLAAARVIVLLVSADYLAADPSSGEVERAIARHERGEARVVPVLVRACDWEQAPFGALAPLPEGGRPVTSWSNADEAWASVAIGLRRVVESLSRGPHAPEPAPEAATRAGWRLVHPYPLEPHFTGRAAERAALDRWLSEDRAHPLLALRALGGFGKSALTWHWLLNDVAPAVFPRVLWWSFYEAESGFESFLREAFDYLRIEPRDPGPRKQAEALLRALGPRGTLLVLDGFERELRAFGGMGASYGGDAGAEGDRDCISPAAEHFLRGLSSLPEIHGKVVMTTRLLPRAIEGAGAQLLAGCRQLPLGELRVEDALDLFRAHGIRGDRVDIERASARYGGHPLSLRLLIGLIATDPAHPGDIMAARGLDVGGDLVRSKHHVLEQAYDAVSAGGRRLLGRIACFRGSVNYTVLEALARADAGEGGGRGLDGDLRDLVRRSLLQHDSQRSRYDLHPIVRRYAYDRLAEQEQQAEHHRLRDYFAALPPPVRVATVCDVTPVIELYHHTARAGLNDEAWHIYNSRLRVPLYYQLCDYETDLSLLESIPKLADGLPRLSSPEAQTWNLLYAAMCYERSGRPRRGLALADLAARWSEQQGDQFRWACTLVPAAMMRCDLGELRRASSEIEQAVTVFDQSLSANWQGISHRAHARVLLLRGDLAGAQRELDAAEGAYEEGSERYDHGQSVILIYRAQLALRRREVAAAARFAELAARLSESNQDPRVGASAAWLAGAARRAAGDLAAAEEQLDAALTRCRGLRLLQIEAPILLELARIRMVTGERDDVLRLADAARETAEQCGYAFDVADAYLILARAALAAGAPASARDNARRARDLARGDGPPDFTYKLTYEEAGELLEELGDMAVGGLICPGDVHRKTGRQEDH